MAAFSYCLPANKSSALWNGSLKREIPKSDKTSTRMQTLDVIVKPMALFLFFFFKLRKSRDKNINVNGMQKNKRIISKQYKNSIKSTAVKETTKITSANSAPSSETKIIDIGLSIIIFCSSLESVIN